MRSSLSHGSQTGNTLTAKKTVSSLPAFELRQLLGLSLCLVFVLSCECAAQSRTKTRSLPRVGTIRDYPATGLTVGCANLYFVLPDEVKAIGEDYVFLARSEGQNAWMNLNGRDVRLQQIKSPRRRNQTARPFKYRSGEVFIDVLIKNRESRNGSEGDDTDYFLEAIITIRKGRAARKIRALGYSDC